MFTTELCPHCGATRQEWARFCGKCRNRYDAPPRPGGPPAPAPSAAALIPEPGRRHRARLVGLVALISVIALGVLCVVTNGSVP
jgi:predicted amidophosphoribosyltransferase